MISTRDAADYLLTLGPPDPEERETSNLKLQKLLYYAQGLCLARYEKPLYSEDIQAWDHGPVVPSIYHAFKAHGANPIPMPSIRADVLPRDAREVLDDAFLRYGKFSALTLRNMTHAERPWKNAYKKGLNVIVTIDSMSDFFSCAVPCRPDADILLDAESYQDIVARVQNPRPPTAYLRQLLAVSR